MKSEKKVKMAKTCVILSSFKKGKIAIYNRYLLTEVNTGLKVKMFPYSLFCWMKKISGESALKLNWKSVFVDFLSISNANFA